MAEISTISASQLATLQQQGPIELVDVRTPMEFQEVHATGARNVPLDSLDVRALLDARGTAADKPLYVICRSGSRAAKACEKFLAAGFTHVVNVSGGTLAWEAAGLPVNRGKKIISLERQVRIAAGVLVLTGAVLALAVHPYYAGICAFVGAGLTFAGITDTCGMGLMLAKMPWNRVAVDTSCCTKQEGDKTKSCAA
jgi:rhodanese-related sulfurtransferase